MVGVGVVLQQQRKGGCVAACRRRQQTRVAVVVDAVGVGMGVQQQLRDVVASCVNQRCGAAAIEQIHVDVRVRQQQSHDLHAAILGSSPQRRVSVNAAEVDIGVALQQQRDRVHEIGTRSQRQQAKLLIAALRQPIDEPRLTFDNALS